MQIREQWRGSKNWKLITGAATAATLSLGAIAVAVPSSGDDAPPSINLNGVAVEAAESSPGGFVPFDLSGDVKLDVPSRAGDEANAGTGVPTSGVPPSTAAVAAGPASGAPVGGPVGGADSATGTTQPGSTTTTTTTSAPTTTTTSAPTTTTTAPTTTTSAPTTTTTTAPTTTTTTAPTTTTTAPTTTTTTAPTTTPPSNPGRGGDDTASPDLSIDPDDSSVTVDDPDDSAG